MAQPLRLIHKEDPKLPIIRDVGELLDGFVIPPTDILIVMYEPEKDDNGVVQTKGGIYLPVGKQTNVSEYKIQGKVGLVMKLGEMAFTDDDKIKWHNFRPALHDWVVVNIGDSFSFDLPGDRRARLVHESQVKMIAPDHSVVW
jgi:hypothetical protein